MLTNTTVLNEMDRENEAIYHTVPIGIIMVMGHLMNISFVDNPVVNKFIEGRVKNLP